MLRTACVYGLRRTLRELLRDKAETYPHVTEDPRNGLSV